MKCLIFAALFAVVAAGTYKVADYAPEYESPVEEVEYEKQAYSFAWDVKDEDTYNDFVHSEKSDGKVITGSYRVELPDGRTQIVNYRADENGNVADVTYEGEAQYPDEKEYKTATHVEPVYSAPVAPAYRAPAYSAPAYRARTYSAPAYSAPAYSAPAYSAPQYKGATYAAPIFRSAYKTPVYPSYPTYY